VWLWLTDPNTGQPEEKWWKISHVLASATDDISQRVDDPLAEPPGRPPLLELVTHENEIPLKTHPTNAEVWSV
jgi:hypothetical protein